MRPTTLVAVGAFCAHSISCLSAFHLQRAGRLTPGVSRAASLAKRAKPRAAKVSALQDHAVHSRPRPVFPPAEAVHVRPRGLEQATERLSQLIRRRQILLPAHAHLADLHSA
ncbi:hypothetical protein SHIRM173S_06225 [Streptomyces hirsutus]